MPGERPDSAASTHRQQPAYSWHTACHRDELFLAGSTCC